MVYARISALKACAPWNMLCVIVTESVSHPPMLALKATAFSNMAWHVPHGRCVPPTDVLVEGCCTVEHGIPVRHGRGVPRADVRNVAFKLVVILFSTTPHFVACECLRACPMHALAQKLVRGPVLIGTVFGAVGLCCAAPTVPQLVSGGGEKPTLRAHEPHCRALLFDSGGRGLG